MAGKEKEKQKPQSKEFNISLRKSKQAGKADIKKARRAIALIFAFFKKHYRKQKDQVILSKEVNETIWKNSNRIPSKISIQAIEKEGKILVYLKNSKELAELEKKEKEKHAKAEKQSAEKKEPKEKEEAQKQAQPTAKEPNQEVMVEENSEKGKK